MTTTQSWPPRPADRVRHGWRCTRRGPTVETVRRDQTSRARVVAMCQECGHDDMAERLRADTAREVDR